MDLPARERIGRLKYAAESRGEEFSARMAHLDEEIAQRAKAAQAE
ncbi:MAG: hypothetical protein ACLU9S_21640 [Oscillospiraceae bacterium]